MASLSRSRAMEMSIPGKKKMPQESNWIKIPKKRLCLVKPPCSWAMGENVKNSYLQQNVSSYHKNAISLIYLR